MTRIAKSSSPRTPNGSRTKWTSNCSRRRPRTIWTSTKCSTWSPKRCWWTNCSNWCKTTSKRAAILCFIRRGTARRRTSAVELAESRSNQRLFSFVYWVGVCDDDECSMRVSGCCVFYFDRHGRYTVVVANIYIYLNANKPNKLRDCCVQITISFHRPNTQLRSRHLWTICLFIYKPLASWMKTTHMHIPSNILTLKFYIETKPIFIYKYIYISQFYKTCIKQ